MVDGLRIRPGSTPPLPAQDWRGIDYELPHQGFAEVRFDKRCETPILEGTADNTSFYFNHSFAVPTGPWVKAWATYSNMFPAVIDFDRTTYGVQFHPEESGEAGLNLLRQFARVVENAPEGRDLILHLGPAAPRR